MLVHYKFILPNCIIDFRDPVRAAGARGIVFGGPVAGDGARKVLHHTLCALKNHGLATNTNAKTKRKHNFYKIS